jgi:hypothetical protein
MSDHRIRTSLCARRQGCLRRAAGIVLSLMMAGAGAATAQHSAIPTPTDLRQEGAQAARLGKPVMILFSLPDCSYCVTIRRNYLAPLALSAQASERQIVRELVISSDAPMLGFDGERTSARTLATHYGARFSPTVVLVDGAGDLLAPPLIGGDVAGMYGAYLDAALATAQAALSARALSTPQGRAQ